MPARSLSRYAAEHWFVLLLPVLLLLEYGFARSTDWARPGAAEAAILFDLCLFVPGLFLLCYRRRLPVRTLLIRAAALSLLGLFVASQLVPVGAQGLLAHLSWLRPFGLAVLALVELSLFVALVRMVYSGAPNADQVAARTGTPVWIVRLMLLEARFWKAVWRLIRRR